MAITFVSSGEPAAANTATMSMSIPSSIDGDMLLFWVLHRRSISVPPAGWTFVGISGPITGGGTSQWVSVFSKRKISTDTTVSVTTSVSDGILVGTDVFRGVVSDSVTMLAPEVWTTLINAIAYNTPSLVAGTYVFNTTSIFAASSSTFSAGYTRYRNNASSVMAGGYAEFPAGTTNYGSLTWGGVGSMPSVGALILLDSLSPPRRVIGITD